jgi:hypothetical protein
MRIGGEISTEKLAGKGDDHAARAAARLRRRLAAIWRHRKAIARATALAAPLLWAFTGKAADLTRGKRRRS